MQVTHYMVYGLPQHDEIKKIMKETAGTKQQEFK